MKKQKILQVINKALKGVDFMKMWTSLSDRQRAEYIAAGEEKTWRAILREARDETKRIK